MIFIVRCRRASAAFGTGAVAAAEAASAASVACIPRPSVIVAEAIRRPVHKAMSSAEPTQSANPLQVTAGEEDAGTRLDKLLAQRVDGLSRARIQALIRSGNITDAGGRPIDDSACRVKPGDTFKVVLPPPVAAEPRAEKMPLSVVYEDSDLIVIDKPAHMVVHPAPGHAEGTLVNALIAHCGESLSGIGGVRRPGIVHRLDKGTSGLLVVAKNDAAHQGLAEQFAAHGADGRMHRAYRALVWGKPLRP
ncbi:MAG TPA: RluA family pseudouridine synthase, partial [Sphingobium sp.]|nr:RluA family pseudouridine synthase [Sphingobium sp.]